MSFDKAIEHGKEKPKPTHSDILRAMSDEELAEFFGTLPCCPPGEDLEELCFPNDSCEGTELKVKCWLKWLKKGNDIRDLPAADVAERKTAIWRYQVMTVPGGKGQTYAKWSCSRCRKKEKKRSPYCPNCGAKMLDGGSE